MESDEGMFWDEFAAVWINMKEHYDQSWDECYHFTVSMLRTVVEGRQIRLLDVGCGTASILKDVLKRISKETVLEVYGFDISERMINEARKNIPSGIFEIQDMRKPLKYENSFFDLVIITSNTIGMIQERYQLIREIRRILKKSGELFISAYNATTINKDLAFKYYLNLPEIARIKWFDEETNTVHASEMLFSHWFYPIELEDMVRRCGFKIIEKHFKGIGMIYLAKKI